MIQVESELELAAPLERVWQALTEFASYPDWNPNLALRGTPGVERHIECSFRWFTGGKNIWTSVMVIAWEPARTFSWRFRIGKFLSLEESYSLRSDGRNTVLRHSYGVEGLFVKFVRGRIMRKLNLLLLASDKGLCAYLASYGRTSTPVPARTPGDSRASRRRARRMRSGRT